MLKNKNPSVQTPTDESYIWVNAVCSDGSCFFFVFFFLSSLFFFVHIPDSVLSVLPRTHPCSVLVSFYCCDKLSNTLTRHYFVYYFVVFVSLDMCGFALRGFVWVCALCWCVFTVHESGVSVNKTITVLPVCPRRAVPMSQSRHLRPHVNQILCPLLLQTNEPKMCRWGGTAVANR